jgi:acyl-CoA synthetase (AMP-forming)/AMP-acid ligase II/heme oxygenase
MRELYERLRKHAAGNASAIALSAGDGSVDYGALTKLVEAFAGGLAQTPDTVALLMPRDEQHIAAELALSCLGRTLVPLPDFFSERQLAHILADSKAQAIVTVPSMSNRVSGLGLPLIFPETGIARPLTCTGTGRRIIYTSGTTGAPKGVVHGESQIMAVLEALVYASGANSDDRHLSVLPFSLLLEQVAGIYLPLWVGAQIRIVKEAQYFPHEAESFAPTTTVLVPELLKSWLRWLKGAQRRGPESLRLVAVGGAPVPEQLAGDAWQAGLPVYEGYGLSECASVVALNRIGERGAGTAGRPLPGISVTIDQGEIVVSGNSVMQGYLNGAASAGVWRTGDLGAFDDQGRLIVLGRKDDIIVTDKGRNIHPEWLEPMLLSDPRIARAAVIASEDHPAALLVPAQEAQDAIKALSANEICWLVQRLCAEAPDYARPRKAFILSLSEATAHGLFTLDGRPRRKIISHFIRSRLMNFYEDLQQATTAERREFMSIPLIQNTIANGVDIPLYLSFLESAYHHVHHTVPLLNLALESCSDGDSAYAAGLREYVSEETGHDEWILEDIADLGGDAQAVRNSIGPFAPRLLAAYAYYGIREISPYALLGMVHVLEGMSVALAVKAAESIGQRLGRKDGKGFRYLTSHGNLDIEHVSLFARLLEIIDTPERRRIVIQSAKDFYRLYGDMFREIEANMKQVAHAA